MPLRRLPLLMLCAGAGCAAPEQPELVTSQQPIFGGTLSVGDDAVFMIETPTGLCSAALIAPRTLLTARHCFAPGEPIHAANVPGTASAESVEAQTHLQWRPDGGDPDLALVFLDTAPAVTPLVWNWWSKPRQLRPGADRIRHIGYGRTENSSSGTRRTVTVALNSAGESLYDIAVYSGDPQHGICFGDSGGPAMLLPADGGAESVIGVHTGLDSPQCGAGYSTMLSPYRDFVESWLTTHEDAGCWRDARCVNGCAPVDPDCACARDGVCGADCYDFDDPDCPAACGFDGECSSLPCPLRDEDCELPGGRCQQREQCPGRECITDPQHPNKYCSQSCSGGCPDEMACDLARQLCIKLQLPVVADGAPCADGQALCREGAQCLGGACTALCTSNLDCPTNHHCRAELPRLCVGRTVVLPKLEAELPAAQVQQRCEASGAGAPAGLLLLLLGVWRVTRKPASHAAQR